MNNSEITEAWIERIDGLSEEDYGRRFDLYGALYILCTEFHSGQGSRGYRILSRLSRMGYKPGIGIQNLEFETEEQAYIYLELRLKYARSL